MNRKAYQTLEYNKIIEKLETHAGTPAGKELCRKLEPMTSLSEIRLALQETSDAEHRIIGKGSVSFSGVRDIRASVKRLEVGSSLGIVELLQVSSLLNVAARAKAYGRREGREAEDSLEGYFASLEPLTPLNQDIKRCILSEEEISDDASPALRHIRRGMRNTNDRIHSQLNALVSSARNYLQDAVITIRDGRYCLPVKQEYKSNVAGLIHDQSSTGSTYFIEPMAIVKLNNELRELEIQEQKEIETILAVLSVQAAEHSETLVTNFQVLTTLDFIFAKALLSRSYKGTLPLFNENGYLKIKQGRHPLLPSASVVPIDVWLGGDFDLLVITGPNTGGKTVTLKTIGLFTLMGQAGMHIPAGDGSELAVFRQVFSDIGDEQSIEQSLSTFSSHMTNIVQILKEADEHSLVLFDELGAGTDPTEGAALATAILSSLHRRGIRTAATTHYSELKVFALSSEGVENACCEFDVATLRPTYRLLIGVPGKSNAFAISLKLGLSAAVIEEAKDLIGKQDEAFEDVIADLETQRLQLERDQKEAGRLRAEVEALQRQLEDKQNKLTDQRNKILHQAKEEARGILQEAKDTADRAIRNMNKKGMSVSREIEAERGSLRSRLSELENGLSMPSQKAASVPKSQELHIGDAVHVLSMNLNGTVSTLPNAKGDLFVQMGILRSQVNISDLELLPEEPDFADGKKAKGSAGQLKMSKSFSVATEINLIGMRVDEAMPELDKYLDDAYLAHLPAARIIHGRGTGALKSAVQTMLRKNKHIAKYRSGEYAEGGNGVTVVEFKS